MSITFTYTVDVVMSKKQARMLQTDIHATAVAFLVAQKLMTDDTKHHIGYTAPKYKDD